MNLFYQTVQLLKERLQSNPLVNTVLFAVSGVKDLQKKNIYNLAYINPTSSPWTNSQVIRYSFEIGVLSQRDTVKTPTTTKFQGNDNVLDNLNTCHAVINDLLTYLTLQNNDFDIELISVTDAIPLLMTDVNTLDGWAVTITLEIPNIDIEVC